METFGQQTLFDEPDQGGALHRDRHTTLTRVGTWLTQEEAEFLESAFEMILPPRRHGESLGRIEAANFVESQILAQTECIIASGAASGAAWAETDLCANSLVGEVYRFGIAAVQRHCIARYGVRFSELSAAQRHVVLGIVELGCSGADLDSDCALFQLLLQHASQAFFEVTQVPLRRRRCAS